MFGMTNTPPLKRISSKTVTVRLPDSLHEALRRKAFEEYDSMCALIRRAIVKAYPELKDEAEDRNDG